MKEETKTAEEILFSITKREDVSIDECLEAMEEYASIKTKHLESENLQLREALKKILSKTNTRSSVPSKLEMVFGIAEQALKKTT